MEELVRKCGATPATIAILNGQIKVGLTPDELNYLANADHVVKVSRRDFPIVATRKQDGATTVAGTMIVAAWAALSICHRRHRRRPSRRRQRHLADLPELSRTSVAVVCAGAKSILDLPATLEWLETAGVPVIGYQTDEFPAFTRAAAGLKLEACADDAKEAAQMIKTKWEMGLEGGVLIVNPIPEKDLWIGRRWIWRLPKRSPIGEVNGIRGKQPHRFC